MIELVTVGIGFAAVGAFLFGPKVNRTISSQAFRHPFTKTEVKVEENGDGEKIISVTTGEDFK